MGVSPKVGVGARRVVRTAVGQGERVPVHRRRDVGLRSPVGKVSVPFLMARAVMMHLKNNRGVYESDQWVNHIVMQSDFTYTLENYHKVHRTSQQSSKRRVVLGSRQQAADVFMPSTC